MKDEIKEILECMEEIAECTFTTDTFELNFEDTKILLDYITNLQEENEKLEKEQLITNMAYETVLNFYKSRNEKAIDLIKNHREELYEINGTQVEIKFQNIVDILSGGDEE